VPEPKINTIATVCAHKQRWWFGSLVASRLSRSYYAGWLTTYHVYNITKSKHCGVTINCSGPHRARNDWLFHLDDEFKGVKWANYPQLTEEMNSSRCSWWVGFIVGMDMFNVSCLFSWSPSTRGSRQIPARKLNTWAHQKHELSR